ncbi:glycosyltransferase family 4 protein [Spirosoma sp. KUDC1026]|uniref:glycosyltransferase family 4 protein n=1 Tax=Spirosoma sp. KUDC1026 TaxID=2745947 RepID=UPI00159B87FB|nr:glycosyltransferase family 4 protein [Spirosoma sp. KUDC1026]QKZ11387.1 glycosyltransferase family 4 protein [Spirosoma sp. KUDC1026]
MNVLWLAAAPHPGKSGHPTPWMTSLANSLVETGNVSITVVSYNHALEKDEELTKDGVKYIYLSVPDDKWDLLTGYTRRIRRVRDYVAQIADQYDLMHIHGIEQQYHVMGLGTKIPKVVSAQGFVTEYAKHLPKKIEYKHVSWAVAGYYEKKYAKAVRHYICRTHWDKAVIRQLNPKAVIHHNWELIRPEFYNPINLPADTSNSAMLFVGGINTMKGIREALCALNELRNDLPLRLIVTGYGTKEGLLELAGTLGLENITDESVEHRGMLTAPQLWEAYHEAFCLLHPSYIDNSPNSVCEAQLAGLPVIATNVGGVASLVEDEETGLLTSLEINDIVSAVQKLWGDMDLRRKLIGEARTVSLERFNARHIIEHTQEIYREVIANP